MDETRQSQAGKIFWFLHDNSDNRNYFYLKIYFYFRDADRDNNNKITFDEFKHMIEMFD